MENKKNTKLFLTHIYVSNIEERVLTSFLTETCIGNSGESVAFGNLPKFHSEILSPWSFLTCWNGLPGIGRQLCIKMWFWHFCTHKIYVTVRGKFSETHFVALFFFNPGEKVWKARKTMGQSFPCFSNLLPGIGEKQSNKVWFWEFSTHRDIYFVCGKMPEHHFDA